MSPIEKLRYEVVSEMMALGTLKKVWPIWKPKVQELIGSQEGVTAQSLRELGNSLYDIFISTSSGTRSQNDVSAGGAAWEVLVCWYLNLCLIGSRTVVVKAKKKHIPKPISDSITVMYGSTPSNTESDLLAITFPDDNEFLEPFSGNVTQLKKFFDDKLTEKFADTELTIIQCKTNWNDNAQIPMLWDLIYSSTGFKAAATVGRNGFVCSGLKEFSYAFVTVPTVKPEKIKAQSTCVMRVSSLSGGNYWGLPSQSGIAMNVFEMLNKNFNASLQRYPRGWNADIGPMISRQISENDYFLISS